MKATYPLRQALVLARGESRGPVFTRLRQAFEQRLPAAAGATVEPAPDEATALKLSLG